MTQRDKSKMNQTAREPFVFELDKITRSDETFKRKKQTQLVDDRIRDSGNTFSMASKKGSDAVKQINADLMGIDAVTRQLDQNSGMQQTEEYPLSRNLSSRNQIDTVQDTPHARQSNKTKFLK